MRILQTAISSESFHARSSSVDKERLLENLAQLCTDLRCELLHLPAGFWFVRSVRDADVAIRFARRIARRNGIAIVGGIDIRRSKKVKSDTAVRKGRLTSFGFAVSDSGKCYGTGGKWRQLSTTSANAAYAPRLHAKERVVFVNGSGIAVVLCGEMHNPKIRNAIGQEEPDAILVCGHRGLGQGLVPTLKAFNKAAGVAILHSQHLRGLATNLHMVAARGISRPVAVRTNIKISSPIWVAAAIRKV